MGKLVAKPPQKKDEEKEESKALAQPDEFVSFWAKVATQLSGKLVPVMIGVGAAILAGVVSWGATKMSEGKKEKASHRLARALKIYAAPLKTEDNETGLAAAKAAAEAMGQDMNGDDDIPRFKTASEKLEATLKEVDSLLADGAPAPTDQQARLTRASVLVDLGKLDDALKAYDAYLADAKGESNVRFLARQGRAVVLEAKGNVDESIAELKRLEAENPFYQSRAQYQQARLLIKKGQKAEGEKLLRAILEKSPGSSLRDEIQSRLAALES